MERIERIEDGFLYGFGLFETVKIVDRNPKHLEKHYKRLKKSALKLNIEFPIEFVQFEQLFFKEIEKYRESSFILRISLIRNGNRSSYFFTYRDITYLKDNYRLVISKLVRDEKAELNYHKTMNYMQNLIELKEAQKNGYDEAIFFNSKGKLAEGTKTNIFLLKGDKIYTPTISSGILAGTMREYIIEKIESLGFRLKEIEIDKKLLGNVDEVFVTNAIIGIVGVTEIDDKKYKIDKIREIKRRLGV